MELKQALDDKIMDYRLRDRLLGEGKISKEEVAKYMKELPDETVNIKPAKVKADTQNSLS
jgi:hypothetical protein